MPTYRLDILITGTDRGTPRVRGFGRALRRVGQIAAGILIAGTIRGITQAIGGLGATAFDAIGQLELMQVGLQSLVAREVARGTIVENSVLRELSLSDAQILSIDKLIVRRHELTGELEEATTAYNDLVEAEGLSAIETLEASIAMREVQNALSETTDNLESLQRQGSGVITVFEQVRVGQISLAEALEVAREPAEQLVKWVTELALISPYEEKDIVNTLRVAAGYGFITQFGGEAVTESERLALAQEEGVVTAQRLTISLLDLIAAIGLPAENLGRITLALGQVRAHGRLLGQEVRQMVNAGVGLDIMALAMGLTVDEFQNLQREGKILAEDFLPKLVELLENDLAGAAERVSRTLPGLQANFTELKRVLLRNFFLPLKDVIAPELLLLYDRLSSQENRDIVTGWGEDFRDAVLGAWASVVTLNESVKTLKKFFDDPWVVAIEIIPEDWDAALQEDIVRAIDEAGNVSNFIKNLDPPGTNLGFEEPENILGGVTTALGALAGFRVLSTVIPAILAAIAGAAGWVIAAVGGVGLAVGIAGGLWAGNFLGIRDITADAWENYIEPAFTDIQKWLESDIVPVLENFHKNWKRDVWDLWVNTKRTIDIELLPVLRAMADVLQEDVLEAVAMVSDKVETELLPRFNDLWLKLENDVIPAVKEFAVKMGTDAWRAIDILTQPLRNLTINLLPETGRAVERVSKKLGEFAFVAGVMAYEATEDIGGVLVRVAQPTFRNLGKVIKEDVLPTLRRFGFKFWELLTILTTFVDRAWENAVLPMLEGMFFWFGDHIAPVFRSFFRLLVSIGEVLARVWGGLWVNIVMPRMETMWKFMKFFLNKAWEDFVAWVRIAGFLIGNVLVGWLQILGYTLFPVLEGALIGVENILRIVVGLFDKLAGHLEDSELPDWAIKNSPIPIVDVFEQTARAIGEADAAFRRSNLFKGSSMPIQSPLMFGAGTAGAGVGNVVFEGDENNFIVDSESLGRFVVHQLREQKLKRFSEFMGR